MTRSALAPRVHFSEPVLLSLGEQPSPLAAHGLNLSRGGMFVEAVELAPVNAVVSVFFDLPGAGPVEGRARVLRAVAGDGATEPHGMALRFEDLEHESAQRLEAFIEMRMQPALGERVRVHVHGVSTVVSAKMQSRWGQLLAVDAELPFLELGTRVTVCPADGSDSWTGAIAWVTTHVSPDNNVPRLNIGLQLLDEQREPSIDEEHDPVHTPRFAEHAQRRDGEVRGRAEDRDDDQLS